MLSTCGGEGLHYYCSRDDLPAPNLESDWKEKPFASCLASATVVQLSTLSRTTGGTRESRTSAQLSQKVPFGPFIPVLQFNWTLLNQRPPFDVGQHSVHYEQICYIKVVWIIKDVEQKYEEGTGKDTWCVCTDVLCCNVSLSVLHQIHKDTMLPKHRWKECPCNLGFMVCTCQLGRWNKAVKTSAVCWRPTDTTDHFHKVWPRKFIQEVSYTNKKSILFIRNLLNIQDSHYLILSIQYEWITYKLHVG